MERRHRVDENAAVAGLEPERRGWSYAVSVVRKPAVGASGRVKDVADLPTGSVQ